MDPQQILMVLAVVQALGSQIGELLSVAKEGGATNEQLQAAYDEAHARAMAYVPLVRPPEDQP